MQKVNKLLDLDFESCEMNSTQQTNSANCDLYVLINAQYVLQCIQGSGGLVSKDIPIDITKILISGKKVELTKAVVN